MGKTLALKAADGRVAIMSVADGEGYEAKAIASFSATKFVPVSITEIDPATVPTDRTFRDAWKFDNEAKTFDHDMDRAREVHRERIRKLRKIVFKQLDTDSLIATETGDRIKIAEIVAKKNSARDAPADPRIDAAQNVDELKLVDPLADLVEEYKRKIHPSFIEEAKHV